MGQSMESQNSSSVEISAGMSRWRQAYIVANVLVALLFILTACTMPLGNDILLEHGIPPYACTCALLAEIGLLLVLGYGQSNYSKRFRIFFLTGGIITILEAGILLYYAAA